MCVAQIPRSRRSLRIPELPRRSQGPAEKNPKKTTMGNNSSSNGKESGNAAARPLTLEGDELTFYQTAMLMSSRRASEEKAEYVEVEKNIGTSVSSLCRDPRLAFQSPEGISHAFTHIRANSTLCTKCIPSDFKVHVEARFFRLLVEI